VNLKLLQLVSPSLPVGAFSYSQGLEAAIDAGIVHDAASARAWIGDVLRLSFGTMEAPVFLRLAAAWRSGDVARAREWNDFFVASREAAELRAETLQMGYSLRRLLRDLGLDARPLEAFETLAWPTAFTFAVAAWKIDAAEALEAYAFAWIESQVLAALKAVPLGQTDGQRLVLALAEEARLVAAKAGDLEDGELGNFAPGLSILASRHETQYSRLFRS
jgi:urease accessory protein